MDEIMDTKANTVWQSTTKYIVAIGIFLFGLFTLYLSRSILTLLITSALLAFVASPVIKFLQRRLKVSHKWSVVLTYLIAIILLLTVPFALASQITRVLNFFLGLDYLAVIEGVIEWFESSLISVRDIQFLILDPVIDNFINSILNTIRNIKAADAPVTNAPEPETVLQAMISAFVAGYDFVVDLVGFVVSGVLAFIFLIMSAIYFSLDGENFLQSFINNLPPAYKPEISALVNQIRRVWEGFFRGQVTLMVIIGSAVWIGGSLIGLPFALLMGVIAGFLEIIPNLGPTLATIPAVILALILGPTYYEMNHLLFALLVIAFYVLIQFFENSIIVPNIMGEAVDLHPVIILSGVFVGASVWGILGALIAAPVIATFKEILGYFYYKIAWEEPTTKYEAPPEGKKGMLEQVKSFLLRFRPTKSKSQSKPDIVAKETTHPPSDEPSIKQQIGQQKPSPKDQENRDKNEPEPSFVVQTSINNSTSSATGDSKQKFPLANDRPTLAALFLLSIAGLLSGILLLNKPKDK